MFRLIEFRVTQSHACALTVKLCILTGKHWSTWCTYQCSLDNYTGKRTKHLFSSCFKGEKCVSCEINYLFKMRALYKYFKICAFLGTCLKQTLGTQMQFETFHFYITGIVSVIKSSLPVKEKKMEYWTVCQAKGIEKQPTNSILLSPIYEVIWGR